MLTYEQAKNKGFDACIEKLGRDFVRRYSGNAVYSHGQIDENVYCYVGVSTRSAKSYKENALYLDEGTPFEYRASCNVNMTNGSITFIESVLPAVHSV